MLGTTSIPWPSPGSGFHFLEWKSLISPTVGTTEVRLDGVSILTLTNQNTRATANSSWNGVYIGQTDAIASSGTTSSGNYDFDDLYVLDGTGSAPWNNFLGDVRIDTRLATGASANGAPNTQWTPSAGSNYQNVDETTPNDDTDFNSGVAVDLLDTFVVQDCVVAGVTVLGAQVVVTAKRIDASLCSLAAAVRHSSTNYVGASLEVPVSYASLPIMFATNPGTSAQWTESEFNNAEFGYQKTA